MSFLANMDEAETEPAKKMRGGQLMDGEERGGRSERLRVERNEGWRDDGMKGRRWETGCAHGKYAL